MILVVGGTGRLGSRIVADLVTRGEQVRVLARGQIHPQDPSPGVEMVSADIRDRDSLSRATTGASVVVSAVTGFPAVSPTQVDRNGNIALVAAARREAAELVLVSVAGAAPNSPMELMRAKYVAERVLAASGIGHTVVRPDAFAETWLEVLAGTAGRSHRPLVFGRGDNPIGFVGTADVAALVVRAVLDQSLRGCVLTVAGPDRLTLEELAVMLMQARGWPGRPRRVPRAVLHLVSGTVGGLRPRVGRMARASLAMDELPPAYDDARERVPDLPCTSVQSLLG